MRALAATGSARLLALVVLVLLLPSLAAAAAVVVDRGANTPELQDLSKGVTAAWVKENYKLVWDAKSENSKSTQFSLRAPRNKKKAEASGTVFPQKRHMAFYYDYSFNNPKALFGDNVAGKPTWAQLTSAIWQLFIRQHEKSYHENYIMEGIDTVEWRYDLRPIEYKDKKVDKIFKDRWTGLKEQAAENFESSGGGKPATVKWAIDPEDSDTKENGIGSQVLELLELFDEKTVWDKKRELQEAYVVVRPIIKKSPFLRKNEVTGFSVEKTVVAFVPVKGWLWRTEEESE